MLLCSGIDDDTVTPCEPIDLVAEIADQPVWKHQHVSRVEHDRRQRGLSARNGTAGKVNQLLRRDGVIHGGSILPGWTLNRQDET